ncbi:putative glycosyltransferase BC10 [Helianthus debilis subsp. tardiflorus]
MMTTRAWRGSLKDYIMMMSGVRQRPNFKGPNWVIILVCLVRIILVGLYIYQPRNTATCYIFLSRGCSDLENTPAVPSRELTDEENAARVVITEILNSSHVAPKNTKVAFMFFLLLAHYRLKCYGTSSFK